jgi:hypothetical protein
MTGLEAMMSFNQNTDLAKEANPRKIALFQIAQNPRVQVDTRRSALTE